jgi:ABC-type Mn2+/Zn2+ transport system permease subunit
LTHFVLLCLITLTVAASFQVVGTLLVFGLLIAPPAAALVWAKSIRSVMVIGSLIGVASVVMGLWISWFASTAAGATIALVAALSYFGSALARSILRKAGPERLAPESEDACIPASPLETEPLPSASHHV